MRAVIVGCGRVGAALADSLDRAGHRVLIIDTFTPAFDRLPSTFRGEAVRGDGTDEDTLLRLGATGADLFVALTEGDNRNIMAAQVARETLGVPLVLAKVNDPVRARAYAELGIATINRTTLMADAILAFAGYAGSGEPAINIGHGHEHPMDMPPLSAPRPLGSLSAPRPLGSPGASRPFGSPGVPTGTTREG
jgi:trk system potassium uptake protein TrkA